MGYEKSKFRVYINVIPEKEWPDRPTDTAISVTPDRITIRVRQTKERGPNEIYTLVAAAFARLFKSPIQAQAELWCSAMAAQEAGSEGAYLTFRDGLILPHLGIVPKIAYKIVHARLGSRYSEIPYLIAEGNLGLVEAFNTFDPFKGMYSTHANFWIKKRMFEYVRLIGSNVYRPRGNTVIPDRSTSEVIPDGMDVVNRANRTIEDKLTAPELQRREWQAEDSSREREEDVALEYLRRGAARVLVGRELRIFIGRYFSPKVKLKDLGAELGISEGMVRKIARRALRKVNERTTQ